MRYTGRIGRIILTGVVAASMSVALALPGWASSGSIGPSNSSTSWSGKTFTAGATPSPAACTSVTCDYFTLSVAVPSSYWTDHDGHATVSIHWGSSSDNFDLYVSRAGSSASSSSTSEAVSITDPSGTYTVTVVPKLVTASGYSGSASFSAVSKPQPKPTGGGSGGGGGGSGSGGSGRGSGGGKAGGGKTGRSSGSGGAGRAGGTGGGIGGGGATGQGPGIFPYQPGPSVAGGYSPGGLYPVPASGVFHYGGPYHFAPPFSFGGPGGLHPVSRPSQQHSATGHINPANPGGTVNVPDKPRGQGRAARIQAAPASSHPARIPDFVWVLIPAVLILLAGAGAVVFEPEERKTAPNEEGAAARTADRPVILIPPGPLVLLGFGIRRVARAVMNVAGGLFGGPADGKKQ